MITLTLSSIFLAPGNMLIFAMMLMFCISVRSVRLNNAQKLFCWFIGFSTLGCLFGTNPFNAVGGSLVRCEGLVFWIIICRLAYLHWSCREIDENGVESMGIMAVLISSFFWMFILMGCKEPATPVMAGGFGATMFCAMVFFNPFMSAFPLTVALYGGCRTSIICLFLVLLSAGFYFGMRMKYVLIAMAALIITMGSIQIYGNMSALEKFKSFRISGIGNGSRTHFIKETGRIWMEYPAYKKLIGDGFDSIMFHMKNPKDREYASAFLPDRSHNVFCDMLLQTGVIGLIMFCASLSMAFYYVFMNPTNANIAMGSGLACWIIFGLVNPQGAASHAIAMMCLFGIRKENDKV